MLSCTYFCLYLPQYHTEPPEKLTPVLSVRKTLGHHMVQPPSLLQRVFSSAAVYGRVCFCLVHAFSRHLRHLIPIAAMLPEVARIAPPLILPPAKLLNGGAGH